MTRFHVHLAVADLSDSIRFYSALFGVAPDVSRADYAKWLLDDPRVNFAISQRGAQPGLDHLGFQVDSEEALGEINARLTDAELPSIEQSGAACCYARSNKYWSVDPQGVAWEGFHSLDSIPTFNGGEHSPDTGTAACCAPTKQNPASCSPQGSSRSEPKPADA